MPYENIYNEMVNRGLGGGGGSFTPTSNSVFSWDGSAAASVLGASMSQSSTENVLANVNTPFDSSGVITSVALPNEIAQALYNGTYGIRTFLTYGNDGPAEGPYTNYFDITGYEANHGTPSSSESSVEGQFDIGELWYQGMPHGQGLCSITVRLTCTDQAPNGDYIWNGQNVSAELISINNYDVFGVAGTFNLQLVDSQTTTNYEPINTNYIPVDGTTIQIENGKIMAKGRIEMPALAPSAIYLYGQDGNTYEITVDSTGTLKATRYQN